MSITEILHQKIDKLTPQVQENVLNYIDGLEYQEAEKQLLNERLELLNTKKTTLKDAHTVLNEIRQRRKND